MKFTSVRNLLIASSPLVVFIQCKTPSHKRVSSDRELEETTDSKSFGLVHKEIVENVFANLKSQNRAGLKKFFSDNLEDIAKDVHQHRAQWTALLDNFESLGIITTKEARLKVSGDLDNLASLYAGAQKSRVGKAKSWAKRWGIQAWESGAKVVGSSGPLSATADLLYDTMVTNVRKTGLSGFLKQTFAPLIGKGEKEMYDMMFEYFDKQLDVYKVNGDLDFNASIMKKLDVVEGAVLSILEGSGKTPQTRNIWNALVWNIDGKLKVNTDYVAGKGIVKLIEESGPVMTKVLQSLVADMPEGMKAAVKAVQEGLPPLPKAEIKQRLEKMKIVPGHPHKLATADQIRAAKRKATNSISELEPKILELQPKILELQPEILELQLKTSKLQPEVSKLQTEISGVQTKIKELPETQLRELSDLNDQLKKLQNQLKPLLEKQKPLLDQLEKLQKQQKPLLDQLEGLQKQQKVLQRKLKTIDKYAGTMSETYIRRNLGTASLSDTYALAVYNETTDEIDEYVVKFLKKQAETQYYKELEFFKGQKGLSEDFSAKLNIYLEGVKGELDLTDEIKNLGKIRHEAVYTGTQRFDTPLAFGPGSNRRYINEITFDVVREPGAVDFSRNGKSMIMTPAKGESVNSLLTDRRKTLKETQKLLSDQQENINKVNQAISKKLNGGKKPTIDPLVKQSLIQEVKGLKIEEIDDLTKLMVKKELLEIDEMLTKNNLEKAVTDLEELDTVVKQIYRRWMVGSLQHGVFHPDPHHGNMFIDFSNKGKPLVTFIDVGGTVKISSTQRKSYIALLTGLDRSDYSKTLSALKGICAYKCAHLSNIDSMGADGKLISIVKDDSLDAAEKLQKILFKEKIPGFSLDPGMSDMIKATFIMEKNIGEIHGYAKAAVTDVYPDLNPEQFAKRMEDFSVFRGKVIDSDLKLEFSKRFLVDGFVDVSGRILASKYFGFAAMAAAAITGIAAGDDLVAANSLHLSSGGEAGSCLILSGSKALCISYSSVDSDQLSNLSTKCVTSQNGLWLNLASCLQTPEYSWKGCSSESNHVAYATSGATNTEHRYICDNTR